MEGDDTRRLTLGDKAGSIYSNAVSGGLSSSGHRPICVDKQQLRRAGIVATSCDPAPAWGHCLLRPLGIWAEQAQPLYSVIAS
jgi:hypothetical protein